LKRLAVPGFTGHIADEQHHGSRILKSRVHSNGRIGRARPAGHKTDSRTARQLAMRLGHECSAPLLAVNHKLNLLPVAMKAIQHGKKAFTGHTKSVRNALVNQTFDQ
jgi:hypothetical protein